MWKFIKSIVEVSLFKVQFGMCLYGFSLLSLVGITRDRALLGFTYYSNQKEANLQLLFLNFKIN